MLTVSIEFYGKVLHHNNNRANCIYSGSWKYEVCFSWSLLLTVLARVSWLYSKPVLIVSSYVCRASWWQHRSSLLNMPHSCYSFRPFSLLSFPTSTFPLCDDRVSFAMKHQIEVETHTNQWLSWLNSTTLYMLEQSISKSIFMGDL